jgi:hypothetical protein
VGIGSWRGIGASTVALAVAASLAARGEQPWLIEADPAGGTLAARLPIDGGAGVLERIAFPTSREPGVERFGRAAADVAGVRVVTGPGDPYRAWSCHTPRFAWQPVLRDLMAPVVVDLGRVHGASPLAALLTQLDVVVMVATSSAVSLASTMHWADTLGATSPGAAPMALDITRVAVVDAPIAADRVGRVDAEAELGDRFAGWLPWAPDAVQVLERGGSFAEKRMRRHPFVVAAAQLAERLARWTSQERAA